MESAAALEPMLRFCTKKLVQGTEWAQVGAQAQESDSLIAAYFRTAHNAAWPVLAVLPCAGRGLAPSVAWVSAVHQGTSGATIPQSNFASSLCVAPFLPHVGNEAGAVALANIRVSAEDAWRVQPVCAQPPVPTLLNKFYASMPLWGGLAQDAVLLTAMAPAPSLRRTPGAAGKPKLDRRPVAPFISGDGFRAHCRFACDAQGCNYVPSMLRAGDCVAVDMRDVTKGEATILPITRFLAQLDDLSAPVVLVTHNGDLSMPDVDSHMPYEPAWPRVGFSRFLEHPNLAAWFASNCYWEGYPAGLPRPVKLTCVPIGIENRCNTELEDCTTHPTLSQQTTELQRLHVTPWHPTTNHSISLLVDVAQHPWKPERALALAALGGKPWVTRWSGGYATWAAAVRSHHFILCPAGHGQDTHRTWQALLLGAVPVVKTSAMDSMYDGLPVVIVQSWTDVTLELLQREWDRVSTQSFHMDRILWPYWRDKLLASQHHASQTAAAATAAGAGDHDAASNEEEAIALNMLPPLPPRMTDPCLDPFLELLPPPAEANELAVFAINTSADTLMTRLWHALRSWLRDAVQHGLRVLLYMAADEFAKVDIAVRSGSAPAKLACLWQRLSSGIVQLDAPSMYPPVALRKASWYMFFDIALHRFPGVKYVVHVDDDTLVRVPHLVQFLHKVEHRHRNAVRLGAPGLRVDGVNGGRRQNQSGPLRPGQGPVRLMGHVFTHEPNHGAWCSGSMVIYSQALLKQAAEANFNWTQCVEDALNLAPSDSIVHDDVITGYCFHQAVGARCSDEGEEVLVRFGEFDHVQDRLSKDLALNALSRTVALHKVSGDCFEAMYDGLSDPRDVCDMEAGF